MAPPKRKNGTIPRCLACGRKLPKASVWRVPEGTNRDDLRGAYGDGYVCGQSCAYLVFARLVFTEPEILKLLPVYWRPDLHEFARDTSKYPQVIPHLAPSFIIRNH